MKKSEVNTILYVSLGLIVLVLALGFISNIMRYVFDYGDGYGMMGRGMMSGMMGFGMVLFFIPLIGIVYFVYWILNKDDGRKSEDKISRSDDIAIQDLNRRYAIGEIPRDQYLTMKEDILKTC